MRHPGRQLNHIELVYRPGERALAAQVLTVLGCEPRDSGGTFLSSAVAPGDGDLTNNVVYCSEVTPEQWALDEAVGGLLGGVGRPWVERLEREPQRTFHFGIRFDDPAEFETTVAAVASAASDGGALAGRLRLSGVFRPGDPGSYTDTMTQAFVWTDVVASGLLALGQHVELQLQHG